jgi:hypothetical protein
VVHAREVDGRTLTFGHSGWLWRNSYLLYDRETDSLWHHATGIAMSGPLRGTRLARIASTALMTFDAWRTEHPTTLVLAKPEDPRAPVERDLYADRNRTVAFGLSLELPGGARLYPCEAIGETACVEDEVGGVPVVVVRDAASGAALAFDRRVGGVALSFDVDARTGARPLLRERGGARAWSLRSGAPVEATAERLCPLPATPFERNAWMLQHPAGSVWRRR